MAPTAQDSPQQTVGMVGPGICKRTGCGNPVPMQERGRKRQFCSPQCARKYHNDARVHGPAVKIADGAEDPVAVLEQLIRQASALVRAAREQVASMDPAHVRSQLADAEAARRRAEARVAAAEAEIDAMAEALGTAREDAEIALAALQEERRHAAEQVADVQAAAAEQITAAQAEAVLAIRDRERAAETTKQSEADARRARQAEASARADAVRERDALCDQHRVQLEAVTALTNAERARAERAEAQLKTESTDRRRLTNALTAREPVTA